MKTSEKRKLFNLAHFIKCNFGSFSQALKAAWKIIKLQLGKAVTITFAKSGGEVRDARAIACSSLETVFTKGFLRFVEQVPGGTQWRSFRIERMIIA